MKWRLIAWTAVSAFMHVFILILPFAIMSLPIHRQHPREEIVPVKIVENVSSHTERSSQILPINQQSKQQDPEPGSSGSGEEGVSFKAEGKVSADFMTLLKAKIFYVWKYPDEAVQKGRQGNVGISFILNSKGEVVDIGIIKSSGSPSLDSAAIDAIRKASPFGPVTSDDNDKSLKITGHFCYVLD
jgi:TonB family protein